MDASGAIGAFSHPRRSRVIRLDSGMITLLVSSAFAYELTGLDWTWQEAPLEYPVVLDYDSFPPGLATEADLVANIEDAVTTWSDTRADFFLEYGGVISGPRSSVIRVHYVESSDGPLLGAAQIGAFDRDMDSCEIQVYRSNSGFEQIPWSFNPNAANLAFEEFDFQTVLLHELGHCFGIDHSEYTDAVMYFASYNGEARRTLSDDDEDALIALYGKGSCSTVGSVPRSAAALLLPLVLSWRRRTR